jgi:tetratricopeptide (TPR) repeat protein
MRLFGLAVRTAPLRSSSRATAWNGLGVTYKAVGRYGEAERCYRAAWVLARASADQSAEADVLHNQAGLAHATGRPTEGIALAERAVALRSSIPGARPETVAADRAVLASLLALHGQTDGARALLVDVLDDMALTYGPDHYEVAVVLHNLAAVEPDVLEAIRQLERARAIKASRLRGRHPEVAAIDANLGVLLERAGRSGEARDRYGAALPVLERRWGNRHPATMACRDNLSRLAQSSAIACGRR